MLKLDGTLDHAALQLQPSSNVSARSIATFAPNCKQKLLTDTDAQHGCACSKESLVDGKTSKTEKAIADVQHKILHGTTADEWQTHYIFLVH